MIEIKPTDEFTVKLTGEDLQAISLGLGEIAHKLAAPVETKLAQQIRDAQAAKTNA